MDTILVEEYSSIYDFIRTIKSRPVLQHMPHPISLHWSNAEWIGIPDYQTCMKTLEFGWDKYVPELRVNIKKIEAQEGSASIYYYNDVVGEIPNIPLFLSGNPKNMINVKKGIKKAKILKFIICIDCQWTVSDADRMKYYSKVLGKIINLEKQGFRCGVSIINIFGNNTSQCALFVLPIKNVNQPLNIKKMSFPLISSAMLRCVSIDWFDRLPNGFYLKNYGTAFNCWEKSEQKSLLRKINLDSKNTLFFNFGDDFEEHLKSFNS